MAGEFQLGDRAMDPEGRVVEVVEPDHKVLYDRADYVEISPKTGQVVLTPGQAYPKGTLRKLS